MNFYIHIGYPKAASTFLQKTILPKLKNCNVLDKDKSEVRNQIFYRLITLDEAEYNKNKKNLINTLYQEVKKINKTDKIYVSWPGFINPIKFHTKTNPWGNNINRTILRINEIFSNIGKVNFILIIRNYSDLIESFFNQINHLLKFDFKDEHLIQALKKENEKYKFLLDFFYFSRIINLFSNNKINNSVILYEDLIYDTLKFQKALADAFDNEEINTLDFDNLAKNRKNSRLEKNNITYKMKKIYEIFFTKKFKIYGNSKISAYKTRLKGLIKILSIKNINKENYNHLVSNYFMQDYDELPENIKQQCKKYNYIDSK
tara:strand:+ start:42 stop:992 length:951 start_codon:yes stop_codon:yes gene_type:complete